MGAGKKLYNVYLRSEKFVVAAKDKTDVRKTVEEHMNTILSETDFNTQIKGRIRSYDELPNSWCEYSVPYNKGGKLEDIDYYLGPEKDSEHGEATSDQVREYEEAIREFLEAYASGHRYQPDVVEEFSKKVGIGDYQAPSL